MKKILFFLSTLISFVTIAQPTITSITPATGKPGDTIVIVGSSFAGTVALTDVFFGNAKVTKYQSASSTTLRVIVPIGATYAPILVLDKLNNRYGTSRQFFSPVFSKPKGSFTSADMVVSSTFSTGSNPYNVAVGDIDGDGKQDAVVVNYSANTVSVLRNTSTTGSASFAAKVDFATGTNPYNVAIADINNDSKLDVIVVNNGASTVSVLQNTSTSGTVSFAAKIDYATGASGSGSTNIAIADLDNDKWQDIIVSNGGNNKISFIKNNSTISSVSFLNRVEYTTGTTPRGLAIADIDGDSKLDVVVANAAASSVSVIRNTTTIAGSLTLATKVDYSVGLDPYSVAVGDIDADGKLDVIVSNYTAGTISTLRNNSVSGTVSLATAVNKTAVTTPETITVTDIDADGKLDVMYANDASSFSVFKNTTTTTTPSYATSVNFTTGSLTKAHAMGDIDGDGKIDAVVITNYNNAIVVVRNAPAYSNNANLSFFQITGTAYSPILSNSVSNYTATISNATSSVTVKATKAQDSATIEVQVNGGTYSTLTSGVFSSALGMKLGENIINIRVTAQDGVTVKIYTFTVTREAAPTITSISPTSGPVGTTVTITGKFYSSTPTANIVYFGATKATITAGTTTSLTVTVPTGATYAPITVVNLDAAYGLSGQSKDYFNTTFKPNKGSIDTLDMTPSANFGVNTYPKNVAIGDIDGDGKSDAVVLDAVASKFSVLRNTSNIGVASFATKVDFTTLSSPETITLGDINNDGKLDVIVVNFLTDSVSIFRNTSTSGAINFAPMVNVLCGLSTGTYRKCVIGDIDGDGLPDITLGTYSLGQYVISVLRNTSTTNTNLSFAFFTTFVTGNNPIHLAIGDIDNDGKLDIVTANANPANATGTAYYQISTLKNTSVIGTISFATKQDFTVDGKPSFVALGDIDGDGINDIITGNVGTNNISILTNYSNATGVYMGIVKNITTGINSADLAVADFDGDGRLDIAVEPNGKGLYMLRNMTTITGASNITFAIPVTLAKNITLSSIVAGDMDGDGKADITAINTTTNDSLIVLRNAPILSGDNNLTTMSASVGALVPVFDSLTVNYTINVHNNVTSTTVTATKHQDSAKIEIQYNAGGYTSFTSGSTSSSLPLNVGMNIVNFKVTAQNGGVKIYTIVINRACLAPSSTTSLSVCPSQMPYSWNGLTFTTAGTKSTILTTANGCDSSVTLNLTLKANSTSTTTLSACDSLKWNGTTYKISGSYTAHLLNSVGCDSAATVNLTIKKSTTSWTDVVTCDSTFWNGKWYSKSGFYTLHFTNKAGCDSAASLNLTVNTKPIAAFESYTGDICNGDSTIITINVPSTVNRQFLHVYTPVDTIFEIGTASFGPDIRTTPINTNIITYSPNSSPSNQACSTTFATGIYTGKVALIDRGTCTFAAKAKAVQDAGAIGIIIVNNVAGGAMAMGGTDPTITIPVISISQADGQIIKNWINAGQNVDGFSVVHTPTYLWSTGATTNNIIAKPTSNTIYSVTVSYENGCSQIYYAAVQVRQKSTSTTNISTCDSTIWNGTTYKTSGQYVYHTLNKIGCDSAATLNLTINKPTSSWTDIVTCDSAFWNGVWYKQNGQYTVHLTNSKGCDSAALLNLTITPKPNAGTISGTNSFCFIGGSTTLTSNGDAGGVWSSSNSNRVSVTSAGKVTASMGGNYIIYYTVTNACGSATSSFNIKVNVPSSTTLSVSACGSYTWNGNTYTTSGVYTKTGMTNVGGCDSTSSLDLTIKNPTTSTTNLTVCDSVIWNGVKYKTSGSYIIHKTNAAGCDSALTLNVTVKKSTTSWTDVIACDSTIWNGLTYKTSGLYIIHKTNAVGCDSALTLALTINKATTSSTTLSVCDSVIWNNTTYKTSGTYTYKTSNAVGCDSTATLNLTIKKATASSTSLSVCDSVIWNNTIYKTSGTYTYKTLNASGCDSIATLNLTIKKATTSTTSLSVCDSVIWNNTIYKTSGTYTYKTLNAVGCDSTATLNLTIKKATTSSTNLSVCDSVIWNNITYKQSGTYTYKTLNTVGCDSTATLNLTIKKATTSTTSLSVCDSVIWNNITYKQSGTYTYKTLNTVGCDSTATLNLTIKKATTSTTSLSVCDSVIWNNTTYKTSGIYTYKTLNASGCDSTATLNLTVNAVIKTVTQQDFFGCNSYVFNGKTYTSSTAIKDTLKTAFGCDSVYRTFNINVQTIVATSQNINVSGCGSYLYNNNTYYTTTLIKDTLRTALGCDSVFLNVNITVDPIVSGRIFTPNKSLIKNVTLSISNNGLSTLNVNSNYATGCLNANNSIVIKPSKNNDITKANGVTSVDVLLTQRHILNTTKLNTPYKIIAADVTGDKQINSTDVLRMKRLILGTDTTFTSTTKGNRLWEFVDSAYTFPDTTNPFPFKDSISFTNLTSNKTNQTFIGVKLGDVNYDWNPTVARGTAVNNLELIVNSEKQMTNNLQLTVTSSNFNNIASLQTTFHFDNTKYEFVSIENNKLQIDYNASKANTSGNIAVLWTDKNAKAKSFDKNEVLFTVVLKPLKVDNKLLTDLSLNNEVAETEAWDNNFTKHSIVLSKKETNYSSLTDKEYLLVYPNPAKETLFIDTKNAKQIKLINQMGKVITIIYNVTNHQIIEGQKMSKGFYIAEVLYNNGNIATQKFVIE